MSLRKKIVYQKRDKRMSAAKRIVVNIRSEKVVGVSLPFFHLLKLFLSQFLMNPFCHKDRQLAKA